MQIKSFLSSTALIAMTLCSTIVNAQEKPTKEQMDAIHQCMTNAGIPHPGPGGPNSTEGSKTKIQLTEEQRQIADNCFKENGVDPANARLRSSSRGMQQQ